ncbi:MAG: molybdopterin-dependent oxidoreductase [Planctomycetaceae bacterium]
MPISLRKKTACTRDCPDACGLIVTIEDGRVVKLQGDPEHPVTQGFICGRTARFPERQNSAERLTVPLLRRQKGGNFEPIEWDDALNLVAEKMRTFREESGPASILQYRCGGSLGIMKHVGDHFFQKFGPVTVKSGDVCAGAGEAAQMTDFGIFNSSDYFDLHQSKTIFLWGKNVFVSSIHLIPELKKARANGAKIVLLDPVHHQTTTIADLYVQPRPGGDAAVAMGMARWCFEHHQTDPLAGDYCDHLEEFRTLAFAKSLDEWAALAGIRSEQLIELAAAYANGPACSMIGWGLGRRRHAAATIRAIDALAAVSGNLGIAGGGASFYFVRRDAFDFSFADTAASARTIPEPLLAPGILAANDPPIRMAFVWAANPVAMLPDSQMMADALRSREFTVVVDPFLTDTAKCADLVLPTTTFLEEEDYVGSYGHHYLAEVHPVVEPPPGVLTDHEIFRELSRRLNIADGFDMDAREWKQRLLKKLNNAGVESSDFEKGYVKNPFVKDVLFADRKFATESGRVNLIRELAPELLRIPEDSNLRVTALSTGKSQASQWPTETQVGPADAIIHPSAARGHRDGDVVTVTTDTGSMQVRLKFDDRQRTDVLLMEKGGWHSAGRSANALIAAEATDDGECAVYYDTAAIISWRLSEKGL